MSATVEGGAPVHADQGLAHESMSQLEVMAQSVAGIAPSAQKLPGRAPSRAQLDRALAELARDDSPPPRV